MNLIEACKQRIPRIRREIWADPNAYFRLPLMMTGAEPTYGPWAELYDDHGQIEILKIKPGSQKMLIFESDYSDFVIYTGPISEYEQDPDNFAHTYLEK